jgi:hypothetical protein
MSSVDFATWVYLPNFDIFARQITFYPVVSQPGIGGFAARGIFDTNDIDVIGHDDEIVTDSRTELDIFMPEWSVYPQQGDIVDIPWESDVDGGTFIVSDVHGHGNAGGELTLTLQRSEQARLAGFLFIPPPYAVASPDFAKPTLT